MEVEFDDDDYDRLETEARYSAGFGPTIVKAYRKKLFFLRQVPDERDLYKARGLRFEELQGDRSHQCSIRLNDQFRLILELHGKGAEKVIRIIGIEKHYE
jgi:proteic killer suppression protein